MPRSIHRPSTATVIACLALFVALAEHGVAAARQLVPANSVGTAQLRNSAVTTPKLHKNAVTTVKVLNGSLLAADFAPGQLPGIRGYEVVSDQRTVGPGFLHNSVFVSCPAGKMALGGGGATGGGIIPGDGPYITSNIPSVNGTGWLVDTTRANPGSSTLVARVICAEVP